VVNFDSGCKFRSSEEAEVDVHDDEEIGGWYSCSSKTSSKANCTGEGLADPAAGPPPVEVAKVTCLLCLVVNFDSGCKFRSSEEAEVDVHDDEEIEQDIVKSELHRRRLSRPCGGSSSGRGC
jgi:hypothetical protein